MDVKRQLFGSLFTALCTALPAFGQDLQSTTDKVKTAYSVDKLKRAKTIRIESDRRFPFDSHEYSADFPDFSRQRFHYVLDIDSQRGSHEYLTEISRTYYHGRSFFVDGTSIHQDYGPNTYQDHGESDFFTQFGSVFRSSDTLLALWIANSESNARHIGETMWLGYATDLIEVDFPNSPSLRIFVRQKDGAITKMERTLPDGQELFYTFQNHEKSGGVLTAREHSFYLGDERVYFSFNRNIDLNDRHDRRAFQLDKNMMPDPERTDQSEMAILLVGTDDDPDQSVHQICQGQNCTTFMPIGESLIGFGLGTGLAERLEFYRQKTGTQLPLNYVIVADHHDEDIGGAQDATEAGAILWVTADTAKKMQNVTDEHTLEIISDEITFGNLRIMPVATDHATSVLVAYHAQQNLFMQTGHYFSSFVDGPSYVRQTGMSLYEAMPEDIRAEGPLMISGQNIKAETWSDFMSAIEKYEEIRCHRNRPICKG